jgi:hypothetical protein
MNDELKKTRKEAVMACLRYYPIIRLVKLKTSVKIASVSREIRNEDPLPIRLLKNVIAMLTHSLKKPCSILVDLR